MGYHTYRLTLGGHEHQGTDLFTETLWEEQLASAYAFVRAKTNSAPIFFLGYSLGGLLVTRVLDTHPEINPAGVVLMAPALSLRLLPQSGYLLTFLPAINISTPNLAPPHYRRFPFTPLFWYRNTLNLYQSTRTLKSRMRLAKVPTLILANPRDELVSLSGIEGWLKDNQLSSSWQIRAIRPAPAAPNIPGHVMIDERSLGSAEWQRTLSFISLGLVGLSD